MWNVVDWANGSASWRECASEAEAMLCFEFAPFAGSGVRQLCDDENIVVLSIIINQEEGF